MIVLMATGNTPIMDWNIFNGMRTLSANIATELPEAAQDLSLIHIYITLVSSSLQTDSKFGGLKKDLNIMLSQEKLPEEFRGDTADIGLRPYATAVSYTHLDVYKRQGETALRPPVGPVGTASHG